MENEGVGRAAELMRVASDTGRPNAVKGKLQAACLLAAISPLGFMSVFGAKRR